jgi:hypothetical protein
MAKVIRVGIQVELNEEEEKAFETVLNVLDKLRDETGIEEWAEKITESGCGMAELYFDLDAIYRACF